MNRKYRVTYNNNGITSQAELVATGVDSAKTLFSTKVPNSKIMKIEEGPVVQPNPQNPFDAVETKPKSNGPAVAEAERSKEENEYLDKMAREHALRTAATLTESSVPKPDISKLDDDFINKLFDPRVLQQAANTVRPANNPVPVQIQPSSPINITVSPQPVTISPEISEPYKYYKNGMRLNVLTAKLEAKEFIEYTGVYKVMDNATNEEIKDCKVLVQEWVPQDE